MAYPQHLSPQTAIFYFLLVGGMRQIYRLGPTALADAGTADCCHVRLRCVCRGLNLCMEEFGIRPGSFWEWPHWQFYEARAAIAHKLNRFQVNIWFLCVTQMVIPRTRNGFTTRRISTRAELYGRT